MGKITKEDEALMDEIRQDPIAYELLRNKCKWEAMGQFAVLSEWGDPREWLDYKKLTEEN